jgi:hypothetical protein
MTGPRARISRIVRIFVAISYSPWRARYGFARLRVNAGAGSATLRAAASRLAFWLSIAATKRVL